MGSRHRRKAAFRQRLSFSAKQLNRDLKQILDEQQIYRIDHYLSKETVQNLMVFRFANSIAEPLWNRQYIDSVQSTAAETVGVRATWRLLRDLRCSARHGPQSSLLFSVALAHRDGAADIIFDADAVRDKQAEILHAVQVHQSGRRSHERRPRTVWRRICRKGTLVGLSQRKQSLAFVQHRNVCRAQVADR